MAYFNGTLPCIYKLPTAEISFTHAQTHRQITALIIITKLLITYVPLLRTKRPRITYRIENH